MEDEKIDPLAPRGEESLRWGEPQADGRGFESAPSHEEVTAALKECMEGLSMRERMLIALFYYYRDPSAGREITDTDVLELLNIINPPLVHNL